MGENMQFTKKLVVCAVCAPTFAFAVDVDLDEMRANTDKYKDINVALADGYISPDNHCVSAEGEGLPPELGAMGIPTL